MTKICPKTNRECTGKESRTPYAIESVNCDQHHHELYSLDPLGPCKTHEIPKDKIIQSTCHKTNKPCKGKLVRIPYSVDEFKNCDCLALNI